MYLTLKGLTDTLVRASLKMEALELHNAAWQGRRNPYRLRENLNKMLTSYGMMQRVADVINEPELRFVLERLDRDAFKPSRRGYHFVRESVRRQVLNGREHLVLSAAVVIAGPGRIGWVEQIVQPWDEKVLEVVARVGHPQGDMLPLSFYDVYQAGNWLRAEYRAKERLYA